MRNKIFGGIGIVWSGSALLNWILTPSASGSEAYQAGQLGSVIFAVLMLVVGIYYVTKRPVEKNSK